MADEDEIDILGDFSFDSCFAQNNQGIPSCSSREDTIHPQWLLDSTANNWYDIENKDSNRFSDSVLRNLSGNRTFDKHKTVIHTTWTTTEKDILVREMAKYGRNIHKISQVLQTKSAAEIQAFIEAEYGINLEAPVLGLEKTEGYDIIPGVVQEEIVTDEITVLETDTTSSVVKKPRKPVQKKIYTKNNKKGSLNPEVIFNNLDTSEIIYEDDLTLGSIESIGTEVDSVDIMSKNLAKYQKKIPKFDKKMGNHKRKSLKVRNSNNYKNKVLKTLPNKDSNLSEDSKNNTKLQIVLSSGQALPLSEGEQVIKIEKKKGSESESDIDIDIDSDNDSKPNTIYKHTEREVTQTLEGSPTIVPLRKFEPMPKRRKKINLDGGGGCTIMHTESGDLYEIAAEPRKERISRKQPSIHLIHCRLYNKDKPAPYEVNLHVSTLISMDAHGHTSRGEVMGLLGGVTNWDEGQEQSRTKCRLTFTEYQPAKAASCHTHCDMDPVSQAYGAECLRLLGVSVCGWHHSHPQFPPMPSEVDLQTQYAMQTALERVTPFLGVITSQHWPAGRTASQYRCIRVEGEEDGSDVPIGYQFSIKLVADLTAENMPIFLQKLGKTLSLKPDQHDANSGDLSVNLSQDVCPQAGITFLEKCVSSCQHHMVSAGYDPSDPVLALLVQGLRDVFR